MAGIITISKGHDASYPWRQIGAEDGAARQPRSPGAGRAAHSTGTGYYLSPADLRSA